MKLIVLALIRFYQTRVSPYKGFSCAYRVCTGRQNCSAYGYRVIHRYGALIGTRLIRRRLTRCGDVYGKQIIKKDILLSGLRRQGA